MMHCDAAAKPMAASGTVSATDGPNPSARAKVITPVKPVVTANTTSSTHSTNKYYSQG